MLCIGTVLNCINHFLIYEFVSYITVPIYYLFSVHT